MRARDAFLLQSSSVFKFQSCNLHLLRTDKLMKGELSQSCVFL